MVSDGPDIYDVVVVGGGSGGLSAGLMLGRYRRRTLIVDAREPRNRWADRVHGYLGEDPADPRELLSSAREDLSSYDDVELREGSVQRVAGETGRFTVETGQGEVTARRLVIATGVRDRFPDVEGFPEHYGTTVFHCLTCDGYEARDRRVVVIGWGEHVTGFALDLLDWARSVTIITNGPDFEGDQEQREHLEQRGVGILEETARELVGNGGTLGGVRTASGELIECDLAFFSIAHDPVTGLAEDLGCETDGDGYVVIDGEGRTSVDGVYAAGDVTGGTQLVVVAAAQGATAAVACAVSLRAS